jgi:hypothetical protein
MLEAQAQHLRDGDDVLAHGEIAQSLFVDVLGKEQGRPLSSRSFRALSAPAIAHSRGFRRRVILRPGRGRAR